jgi:hypothetical protein
MPALHTYIGVATADNKMAINITVRAYLRRELPLSPEEKKDQGAPQKTPNTPPEEPTGLSFFSATIRFSNRKPTVMATMDNYCG